MSDVVANEVLESVSAQCLATGFDLVQPFVVQKYNSARSGLAALPEFSRQETLGLLIGNTRKLWPHFLQHLEREPGLLDREHPLDTYVTEKLEKVASQIEPLAELRFSYEKEARFVALQTVCELSGLAPLRAGMLNIHPTYGPWIALRAVIICDLSVDGIDFSPLPRLATDWEEECQIAFDAACNAAGDSLSHQDIKADWQRWLKVRDTCPIGREHRYGESQILYHYTQDLGVLRAAIESLH